jgi:hypothetical protein
VNAFISFDLHPQGSDDYRTAYAILGKAGFRVTTPVRHVYLPNTTVLGTIPDHWTAEVLRDAVVAAFKLEGVYVASILCGIVSDWAAMGEIASQASVS